VARPVVAIPAYHLAAGRVSRWIGGGYAVPEAYVNALRRAGVRAVVLPAGDEDAPAGDVLAPFDGLVLVGGGDVEPTRYAAVAHPEVYGVEPDRDSLELELAGHAVAAGLPVLAICRGMQLVNVAFGGTLHQHLPERAGLLAHGVPTGGPPGSHHVEVAPGSRLAKACGGASAVAACTSFHHQGVDVIGDGLVAVAWSDDGLVEALELPADADGWLLAVQWHPEMSAAEDPTQQGLFDAFAAQLT
jgi:putative glutamine amidotransferase